MVVAVVGRGESDEAGSVGEVGLEEVRGRRSAAEE